MKKPAPEKPEPADPGAWRVIQAGTGRQASQDPRAHLLVPGARSRTAIYLLTACGIGRNIRTVGNLLMPEPDTERCEDCLKQAQKQG